MQLVLDTIARSFANTPLKASTRQTLVNEAIAHLDSEQAQRFLDIAFEQGEFAPSDSE
ncbi:hypothetical protein SEA_PARADIDDLES_250 [Streptomyces phage Paradiddles]|uniref:Uncharacterized protein n=3 Tax=Samistivirus TaxID=2560220 RepID=A0A222YYE0_9CAUD|nr:hypothetical protein FDI36_gp009 [Streptomyces phage NootNoot]YP_009610984.1 hypothetical protein FDI36_gp045 [Streptomyces phage NootNoot]YP_009611006.1 hypothetical protein FDI37_gp009 [Streptomyces phage Paradiddles]YP_009611200.1 hypothetical protein FDI37_gp045 [Streptomyces phage Paradiddles]YP_010103902.1 hypothetical protein KNU71_gp009 [Streptomyces phage Braelyn]YP_010104108.1 hypothetical protein KNU71_gp048 [Streptomyces phage Braelyn]UGL63010.1 hypothetical protein SEA_BARTHOL